VCGISGIVAFTEKGKAKLPLITEATECLRMRGPDKQGIFTDNKIALGHRRLSIIDTSDAGSQPMQDESGRYTIIFNGEFFNYKEHRRRLLSQGISFRSESDTEVLLHLYMLEKETCLQHVNGFFALAIYDKAEQTVFIARDRMGLKPLIYFSDANNFLFASEIKSLMTMGIPKEIDESSLYAYLQLNYIPSPYSIFKNVKKLPPGHFIKINLKAGEGGQISFEKYYSLPPISATKISTSYEEQQKELFRLLDASVERRMIADVPLGTFLSGGIDSSVVSALASRHTSKLQTFSIGFRDEPMYDETFYADLVAKKIKSEHTVFSLSNDDLFNNIFGTLDYLDEPFADSSALNVFILSHETRKQVTVALSGDGADELFGGYNKHEAELRVRTGGLLNTLLKFSYPVLKQLPQSRSGQIGNLTRKAIRMAEGLQLSASERYWRWAGYASEIDASSLLLSKPAGTEYQERKRNILSSIDGNSGIEDVLLTDMQLVLVSDMLAKVDMMSMANSLEVRVPFLDYTVVDFAMKLPMSSKIDTGGRKKIVRDAFRDLLPEELYTRGKKGFEVPLLKWLRNELRHLTGELLSEEYIKQQGIFSYPAIDALMKKLYSTSPGDSTARIWGLLVFQYWQRKMNNEK
jgi:asparagine synthase (glutamine-hydrolysing)